MDRLFLCCLRVTPPAAAYGVLCFYGIRILARHYIGVTARWRLSGGICSRLYARGRHGRRPPGTTIFWKTACFLAFFYRVRGDEKIRPATSKNSKVAKVARPKVAKVVGPPKSRGPKSRKLYDSRVTVYESRVTASKARDYSSGSSSYLLEIALTSSGVTC